MRSIFSTNDSSATVVLFVNTKTETLPGFSQSQSRPTTIGGSECFHELPGSIAKWLSLTKTVSLTDTVLVAWASTL